MANNYQEAVEKTIIASEQLSQILNGTATVEVTVEDGSKIPSIRKALIDNFYFKEPLTWQQGQQETIFNQLRKFSDGTLWYAPTATANNPVSMGVSPVSDLNWRIYSIDAIPKLTPQIREALRRTYSQVGLNITAGSFEKGAIVNTEQDIILLEETGHCFKWTGGLPKTVPSGSSPNSTGGIGPNVWEDVSYINLSMSGGSNYVGFIQAGIGSSTRTVQDKLRDVVSIKDFGAHSTTEAGYSNFDSTASIQAAVLAHNCVYIPPGSYKITADINIPRLTKIFGAGRSSQIHVFGANGFTIASSADGVIVDSISLFSYSSSGTPDTRSYNAINVNGVTGAATNALVFRDLFFQGWDTAIYGRYLWSSRFENVSTINTNYGITLFGQSVNNAISNSHLVVNGGIASINILPDGSIIGEGLSVTNSLLASGSYGIKTGVGFLSLHISNSLVDLITDVAFKLTDVRSFHCVGNWIFATNKGIEYSPLGSIVDVAGSISSNTIEVTSTTGRAIDIGGANKGINIIGGSIKTVGTAKGIYIEGSDNFVGGVYFINQGTGTSIYLNDPNNSIGACTGNVTVFGGYLLDQQTGTWTPDISADGAGVTKFTTTSATGSYTKIGRQVTIICDYSYSNIGSVGTSYAVMTGLPFPADTSGINPTVFCAINQTGFDTKTYQATLSTGGIYFQYNNGAGTLYNGTPYMVGANFPSSGTVKFVMTYFAAS